MANEIRLYAIKISCIKTLAFWSLLVGNLGASAEESAQVACGRALIAIQDTCSNGAGVTAYYGIINTLIKNRCEVKENQTQVSLKMSCRIAGAVDVLSDNNAKVEICRRALAGCERHFASRPEVCRKQIGTLVDEADRNFYSIGTANELQNCAALLTLASTRAKVNVDGRHVDAVEIKPTGEEGNYTCILDVPGIKYSPPMYFKSMAEAKATKSNFYANLGCKADPILDRGGSRGVVNHPAQSAEERAFKNGGD